MKIAIVGTGYVGLVTGACFAEMGTEVICVDTNHEKIEGLKQGIIPIFEPGLEDLVNRNKEAGRLQFTTQLDTIINEIDVVFIAVGTPPDSEGQADLQYVMNVAATIGEHMTKYLLVVTKSTVPVGTSEKVRNIIHHKLSERDASIHFDIASNPEFLKEGAAIKDFMSPDRVVVGVDSERAKELMSRLYRPFLLNNFRVIFMDIPSAEMTKYAANAMLATRISFMNDIANLSELVGANVNMVRKGIGTDSRIGQRFLYPGCGYGGSCFPKDIKALIKTAEQHNYPMRILQAVEAVNDSQKEVVFNKLNKHYNNQLAGKNIAVWGVSFKPETDDIREAPSLVIIDKLLEAGCRVHIYDPIAMSEAKNLYGSRIQYANDIYETVEEADAILMITEWKEFRMPSWRIIKKLMRESVVIDGRNIYDKEELTENGFTYYSIGR